MEAVENYHWITPSSFWKNGTMRLVTERLLLNLMDINTKS